MGVLEQGADRLTHGPLLGHLAPTSVEVWARCPGRGPYELVVAGQGVERAVTAEATPERDHTVVWTIDGLEPGREYRYEVRHGGRTIFAHDGARLRTPLPQTAPAVIRRTSDSLRTWPSSSTCRCSR